MTGEHRCLVAVLKALKSGSKLWVSPEGEVNRVRGKNGRKDFNAGGVESARFAGERKR